MEKELSHLRVDYTSGTLTESDMDSDPFLQFTQWLQAAIAAGMHEPNAMAVGTVSPDGSPSVRILLLREVDGRGFVFYTNFESRKGFDLKQRPRAAATFWWGPMHRQVRVEGTVEVVESETADAYFATRPRGSQLGAWASPQSRVIGSRSVLDERLQDATDRFADSSVPRPPFWGGYRIVPHSIEFWQGRTSRLHDRLRYRLVDGGWILERMAP